jgi:hypothetical protein
VTDNVTRLDSGYGSGLRSLGVEPELVFYYKGFSNAAAGFQANASYMASNQLLDYLAFLLRVTAKHEVGHMLGFMHPSIVGENQDEPDATGCATQAVFEPVNVAAGPPIMARNLPTTLRLMTEHYGRPVGLNDIETAPQEAAVARAVFDQACPVHMERSLNAASNTLNSGSQCPHVSRVITPNLALVYELLLNAGDRPYHLEH